MKIKITILLAVALAFGFTLFAVTGAGAECVQTGPNGCEKFVDSGYTVEIVRGANGEFPVMTASCTLNDSYIGEAYTGPCYLFEYKLTKQANVKNPSQIDLFIPVADKPIYAGPMFNANGSHYSTPGEGGLNTGIGLGDLTHRIFEWSFNTQTTNFGVISNMPTANETSMVLRTGANSFVYGLIAGPAVAKAMVTTSQTIEAGPFNSFTFVSDQRGNVIDVKDETGESMIPEQSDVPFMCYLGDDPSRAMRVTDISFEGGHPIIKMEGEVEVNSEKVSSATNEPGKLKAMGSLTRMLSCWVVFDPRLGYLWKCYYSSGDYCKFDYWTQKLLYCY